MATPKLSDRWSGLPEPKEDIVLGLDARAKAAPEPKINLVVGAYRDENGKPMPLKVVRKAERILLDMNLDKEYLPIAGDQAFCDECVKLLFGEACPPRNTIASVQALSGTGACRIGAEFFGHQANRSKIAVYISDPTWPNHENIFVEAGFSPVRKYRYFDPKTKGVDIAGMLEDLTNAPENSIVILHLCAHNPTGADPTIEEWGLIGDVVEKRKLQVLFDSAYQGYASGDLVRDSIAARLFLKRGFEFCVAQSFAKNMGLYNERVGCFSVVCANENSARKVFGLLKNIIRPMYSNPPAHGARIAKLIMQDATLRAEWQTELQQMSGRIMKMRQILFDELTRLKTPGSWTHVTKQIGMFSYLGLSKEQCETLQKKRVFVMLSSRVSIAGLTTTTAKLLAAAIDDVVRNKNNSKL